MKTMRFFSVALLLMIFLGTALARSSESMEALAPDRFELLISQSSGQSFESLFGHASLLMIPKGQSVRNGMVVSFVANMKLDPRLENQPIQRNNNLDYYYKGLTGQVPFVLTAQRAENYFYSKIVEERRGLKRIVLPLSSDQKRKIWELIQQYAQNPEPLGKYVFHFQNCASSILFLLSQAGVPVPYDQIKNGAIVSGLSPEQLSSILRKFLVAPYPEIHVPSLWSRIQKVSKKHSIHLTSIYDRASGVFKPWTEVEIQKLEKMDLDELVLAAQSISMADDVRLKTLRSLTVRNGTRKPMSLVEMRVVPDVLYETCEEATCTRAQFQAIFNLFGSDQSTALLQRNIQQENYSRQVFFKIKDFAGSPQAVSWRGLNNLFIHFDRNRTL
jgi:hypothetical protein